MGQVAKAEDSLRQAATLVDPLLTGDPNNRDALLAAVRISHDQMLASETNHRKEEALTQARKAVARLEALLALRELSAAQLEAASEYLYQIAVTHKNLHRFDEGIQFSRRYLEISRSLPDGALRVSLGLSLAGRPLPGHRRPGKGSRNHQGGAHSSRAGCVLQRYGKALFMDHACCGEKERSSGAVQRPGT